MQTFYIFKAGDKDKSYDGKRDLTKALAFIWRIGVTFVNKKFKRKSKLRNVNVYLSDVPKIGDLLKISSINMLVHGENLSNNSTSTFCLHRTYIRSGIGLSKRKGSLCIYHPKCWPTPKFETSIWLLRLLYQHFSFLLSFNVEIGTLLSCYQILLCSL